MKCLRKWQPKVGYPVEVFEDVLTQKVFEGVGKIVKIHRKSKGILDCDVCFYKDRHGWGKLEKEVYRRQIKI